MVNDFTVLRISNVFLIFLILTLSSCDFASSEYGRVFTNIDSALRYCANTKEYKSLLFALVTKDVQSSQRLGWSILGDKNIIDAAKTDYVLIILDITTIHLPANDDTKEFAEILRTQKESPYFVVTNHVLYPFRQFTLHTDKDRIIDDLNVGEGP